MQHLFWAVPGKLAGRAGPELEPWDLAELRRGGISMIVSMAEQCDPESIRAAGMKHLVHYMPESYPTSEAMVARFVELVRAAVVDVLNALDAGEVVLVHCYAGRDRTGLVLAAVLLELHDFDAVHALEFLREVRPTALTGPGVIDVLREYELKLRSGFFDGDSEEI